MAYIVPEKKVNNQFDLTPWFHSHAYTDYMNFIRECNEAVKGVATTEDIPMAPFIVEFIDYLDTIQKWTLDYPPEDEANQRFGNKAFRQWFQHLEEQAEPMMKAILPDDKKASTKELFPYFLNSFGNATRIDYGSGHEMSFIIFLLCLLKLDILTKDDLKALVLRIFNKYLRLCRYLQIRYKMEPAGSRGVHALDDYQFVPFLWGSAQLITKNQKILPDHYTRKEVCHGYGHLSLFLEAVEFIHTHKTGPFHEHSNQLWNISAVPNWEKLNGGMFKMYEAEVLKKFPVVQHTLFGSLFSWEKRPDAPNEPLYRTPIDPVKLEKHQSMMSKMPAPAAAPGSSTGMELPTDL